jgi:hypothetical protein
MLRYLWWAIKITAFVLVAAVLHYTLPQRDVVYVTDTYNRVIQFGENSIFWSEPDLGTNTDAGYVSRDVLFIETVKRNGRVMVYRNEDTGWIWPPYYKFDSSNLQAEASNLRSSEAAPRWAVVTHYGWRLPFMSVFPNAVAIRTTDDPDAFLVPWLNISILVVLFAIYWAIRVRWRRFKARAITPKVEQVDAAIDEQRAGISRWFASWRRK